MRAIVTVEDMDEAKSDIIDMASVHERMNLEAALRNMVRPIILATGTCLHCGAEVAPALRWCPADPGEAVEDTCMAAWDREQKARVRNGQ